MTDRAATPDRVPVPTNAHGLIRADRLMQRARREVQGKVLARYGVTWCDYLLLSTAVQGDSKGFRELASGADVSIHTVPGVMDKLSAMGLLTRTAPDRATGARIRITVTEAGQRQLAAIHAEMDSLAGSLLRELADLLDGGGSEPSDVDWYVVGPAVPGQGQEPGS